ncbi:MAG: hypothetical protein U9Q81_25385 [Pseudomonadota bacterium]|nr:hypothetical protein [Pseudomonadota bacterium]
MIGDPDFFPMLVSASSLNTTLPGGKDISDGDLLHRHQVFDQPAFVLLENATLFHDFRDGGDFFACQAESSRDPIYEGVTQRKTASRMEQKNETNNARHSKKTSNSISGQPFLTTLLRILPRTANVEPGIPPVLSAEKKYRPGEAQGKDARTPRIPPRFA